MTPDIIGTLLAALGFLIAIILFFDRQARATKKTLDDQSKSLAVVLEEFLKHVEESRKHVDKSMIYQTEMRLKTVDYTVKIDSLSNMGRDILGQQKQQEIIIGFLQKMHEKTNQVVEQVAESINHLATVLENKA